MIWIRTIRKKTVLEDESAVKERETNPDLERGAACFVDHGNPQAL